MIGRKEKFGKLDFVDQGRGDKLHNSVLHYISVARQYTTIILALIAAIFRFNLFSTDVAPAYPKSAEAKMRDIFNNPPKGSNLKPETLIKLLKPSYGTTKSGYYCGRTFGNHIHIDLGMKSYDSEAALFERCWE